MGKRYAIWSKVSDINLFKDGKTFKSLSYAKKKCMDINQWIVGDELFVKEVSVETPEEIREKLDRMTNAYNILETAILRDLSGKRDLTRENHFKAALSEAKDAKKESNGDV